MTPEEMKARLDELAAERAAAIEALGFAWLAGGATLAEGISRKMKRLEQLAGSLDAIAREVTRARVKFPGNRFLLAALTEEVGELAQAMLQKRPGEEIAKEAIQVAAVAVRILEEGDASFADITDVEALP